MIAARCGHFLDKFRKSAFLRLYIPIVICIVVCSTCYLVEKPWNGADLSGLAESNHSTEKLIQLKLSKENAYIPTDNALSIEGSGSDSGKVYEEDETRLVRTMASDSGNANKNWQEYVQKTEDNYDTQTSSVLSEEPQNRSEEITTPISTTSITSETAAETQTSSESLVTENNLIGNAIDEGDDEDLTSIWEIEYPFMDDDEFDLPKSSASNEDESLEEYIFTDHDNGDYIELSEVKSSDWNKANNLRSWLDSILYKMSDVFDPSSLSHRANPHLGNFKVNDHDPDNLESNLAKLILTPITKNPNVQTVGRSASHLFGPVHVLHSHRPLSSHTNSLDNPINSFRNFFKHNFP